MWLWFSNPEGTLFSQLSSAFRRFCLGSTFDQNILNKNTLFEKDESSTQIFGFRRRNHLWFHSTTHGCVLGHAESLKNDHTQEQAGTRGSAIRKSPRWLRSTVPYHIFRIPIESVVFSSREKKLVGSWALIERLQVCQKSSSRNRSAAVNSIGLCVFVVPTEHSLKLSAIFYVQGVVILR